MSEKTTATNRPASSGNTEIKISNGVLSAISQTVFYPMNYVKVLIQVSKIIYNCIVF
jgi:hypothetical protein